MGSSLSTESSIHSSKAQSASASVFRRYDRKYEDTNEAVEDEAPPPYEIKERTTSVPLLLSRRWEDELLSEPKNRLAISALSSNSLPSILTSTSSKTHTTHTFDIRIPLEGNPVTNQRSSGRCWLFASTNVFRVALMKRYNLADFQLSQSYLFYWDKIEKANWFLEQMVETAAHALEDRLVQKLFEDPVSDGGQWDMLVNLVEKYGLVPHVLCPDGYHAMNSAKMDWLVTAKLREAGMALRALARSAGDGDARLRAQTALAAAKEKSMREIHAIVTIMLGTVPHPNETFQWDFYDKHGKFHRVRMTPKELAGSLSCKAGVQACGGTNVTELFSLVNDPRNEFGRLLTVDRMGNVVGGRGITYVNVDMDTIKAATISMLRAGFPVFFGCDVGKFSDSTLGIMDLDLFDLSLGFNICLDMNKAERLQTGESAMTHAMVLTGVQVENGKPVRWRVQNSWGENAGDKGWFVMTDQWADQYLYQVVVDPRFVAQEVRDILKQKPKVLPRWDPMGILA